MTSDAQQSGSAPQDATDAPAQSDLGHRQESLVRKELAASSERQPRPVCEIDLPFGLKHMLKPRMLRSLRPAAVLVPLVRRDSGLHVVLTVRAAHLRKHSGQISFPGGRCEPHDASLADAALRETHEEIGVAPGHVELCGYLDDYPTVTRYLVTPVVGVFDPVPAYRPDPREVADIFEVPLALLTEPSNFKKRVFTREGVNVPFFEIHHGGYRIWGATAGMLWNLHQKLQRS